MDESVINFTKKVVGDLQSWHSDLYVGWDVGGEFRSVVTIENQVGIHPRDAVIYGDVVDFHLYAMDTPSYQLYLYGDAWQYLLELYAPFARAINKPVILTETGVLGYGYAVTDFNMIKDSWSIAVSSAISNGFAGVCPWYIESYHGRRPSW